MANTLWLLFRKGSSPRVDEKSDTKNFSTFFLPHSVLSLGRAFLAFWLLDGVRRLQEFIKSYVEYASRMREYWCGSLLIDGHVWVVNVSGCCNLQLNIESNISRPNTCTVPFHLGSSAFIDACTLHASRRSTPLTHGPTSEWRDWKWCRMRSRWQWNTPPRRFSWRCRCFSRDCSKKKFETLLFFVFSPLFSLALHSASPMSKWKSFAWEYLHSMERKVMVMSVCARSCLPHLYDFMRLCATCVNCRWLF